MDGIDVQVRICVGSKESGSLIRIKRFESFEEARSYVRREGLAAYPSDGEWAEIVQKEADGS